MPRTSRHRSHRSHRRGGSAERSESDGEDAGAREEATAGARVPRDPEPERRRSSSGKDVVSSGNGYAEHGRKRKDRVEETVVDVVSDRWNSGVCEDHLVEKRSKSDVFGPVDVEKLGDKPKVSGDESKRTSKRTVGLDDKVEEAVSKSDSGKRRSEKEKELVRRENSGQYKDATISFSSLPRARGYTWSPFLRRSRMNSMPPFMAWHSYPVFTDWPSLSRARQERGQSEA